MNGTKKIKAIFIEAKVPKEKEKNGRSFVMQVGLLFGYPWKRSAFAISKEMAKKDKYMIIHYKKQGVFREDNEMMNQDIEKVLISEEQIQEKVRELGCNIAEDYASQGQCQIY